MRAAHMGKKNIKCVVSECPEMFERNFTLRKHVEKYHPEIWLDGANMTEKREERGYYWNGYERNSTRIHRKPPKKMRPIQERCGLPMQSFKEVFCNKISLTVNTKHAHLKKVHQIWWCPTCQTKMNFKNTTGLKLGNTAFKGGQTGRRVTMKTSKKAILNFRQLKL